MKEKEKYESFIECSSNDAKKSYSEWLEDELKFKRGHATAIMILAIIELVIIIIMGALNYG